MSRSSSVESTLQRIIDRVEIESELENRKRLSRRASRDTLKRSRRSRSASSFFENDEIYCRICYDTNARLPIIYPCRCKGSIGAIHLACLERWLEESNRKSCELCGQPFNVERTPRYEVLESLLVWLCLNTEQHQLFVRNLRVDLLRCAFVTPLTMACTYVCIIAADFYGTSNYRNFPPARWTTYCLVAMMSLLIFSYFVWMYMAFVYHQKVWFYWWQRTSVVRIILPGMNGRVRSVSESPK